MITINARGEVVVPFFRVGESELDIQAILDALRKGAKAAQ